MKHIGLKLSVILSTALLGSSAFALKVMPPADEPTFRQKVLAAYDLDHDGRLSNAEVKAMQAARKQVQSNAHAQMLQRYDLDKNGKLDKRELASRKADHQASLIAEFDINRDGALDKAERKQMLIKRLQTKLGHKFTMMVLRFDADRDNKLQATEIPGKGHGKQKRFRKVDTNRDGGIDRGEFVANGTKVVKAKVTKAKVTKAKVTKAKKVKAAKAQKKGQI